MATNSAGSGRSSAGSTFAPGKLPIGGGEASPAPPMLARNAQMVAQLAQAIAPPVKAILGHVLSSHTKGSRSQEAYSIETPRDASRIAARLLGSILRYHPSVR
jgi:hypothetical protein